MEVTTSTPRRMEVKSQAMSRDCCLGLLTGAKKDRVCAHNRNERPGRREKLPWTHGNGENECNVCSSADIDIFRQQTSEIHTRREGIVYGIDGELTDDESYTGEKDSCTRAGGVIVFKPSFACQWTRS